MLYVQEHPDSSSDEDTDTEDEYIDMSCFFNPPIQSDPDTE